MKLNSGLTPSQTWYRQVYLTSDHWLKTREYALLRGSICDYCSKRGRQVHHRSYKHLWRESPRDLNILCNDCHQKVTYGVIIVKNRYPSWVWVMFSNFIYWLKEQYNDLMDRQFVSIDKDDVKRCMTAVRFFTKNMPKQFYKEQADFNKLYNELSKMRDQMIRAELNDRKVYLQKLQG